MTIDKNLLIDRIKTAYNIRTDYELAKHLSIAATTVSSWRSRNSIDFDIIYAKCEQINWNYLILGVGPYFIQCGEQNDKTTCQPNNAAFYSEVELLRSLAERNDQLAAILNLEINRLKSELERIRNTDRMATDE